jgi:plasmid stability protein
MPALHVRDVDDAVLAALKARARRNQRSLQGEVRSILEAAVGADAGAQETGGRLRLHTVRVGKPPAFTREVIYGDEAR